ncbi:MAG: hypothetical protein ACP5RD_05350 [bacterium]
MNDLLIEKIINELIIFDYTPYLRNIKLKYIKQIDNKNQEVEDFFDKIIPDYRFLIAKLVKSNTNKQESYKQEVDIINFSHIRRIFY